MPPVVPDIRGPHTAFASDNPAEGILVADTPAADSPPVDTPAGGSPVEDNLGIGRDRPSPVGNPSAGEGILARLDIQARLDIPAAPPPDNQQSAFADSLEMVREPEQFPE